ncbi:MAG: hypothetical protein HQ512_07785 [Rhodospirillales bacterium]|nr:hypothetical protein [Rhodospirillales bacterium]
MTKDDMTEPQGWTWFDTLPPAADADKPGAEQELCLAFARCFRGGDGEKALTYLRAITIERALGPNATDTLLRHLEGQRQLVNHITTLARRGRGGD